MTHLDTNAFPIGVPLILMTADGDLLGDIAGMPKFIEFQRAEGGMLLIRSSQEPDKYLAVENNKLGHCFLGKRNTALKFEAKMLTHNDAIVFQAYPTSKALGIITEGRNKYCECLRSYGSTWQGWFVMDELYVNVGHLAPVSGLERLAQGGDAARRQLILHFWETGKSIEAIVRILVLLYGSSLPRMNLADDKATKPERQQQVLEFAELGTSPSEIGEIMKLLYGGTTTQILVKAEAMDQGLATLKGEEGDLKNEAQYVCVGLSEE